MCALLISSPSLLFQDTKITQPFVGACKLKNLLSKLSIRLLNTLIPVKIYVFLFMACSWDLPWWIFELILVWEAPRPVSKKQYAQETRLKWHLSTLNRFSFKFSAYFAFQIWEAAAITGKLEIPWRWVCIGFIVFLYSF